MRRLVWTSLSIVLLPAIVLTAYLARKHESDVRPTPAESFAADAPNVVGMPMDKAIRTLRDEGFEVFTSDGGEVIWQVVGTLADVPAFITLDGTEPRRAPVCPTFFMSCPIVGRAASERLAVPSR